MPEAFRPQGVLTMKRILICASRISHIMQFHWPVIEELHRLGHQIDIAAEGSVQHGLIHRCYDLPFVKNPLAPQNLRTVDTLRRLLRDNSYCTVVSNATLAGAALRTAVRGMGGSRPYTVHISHGYMFGADSSLRSTIYRTAEKWNAPVTDALIVMNREDAALALHHHLGQRIYFTNGMGLCPERLRNISDSEREALRRHLGAGPHTRLLLCVGELSRRKNQRLLIEAFNTVQRRCPDCMLLLAGQGAIYKELLALTQGLELQKKVRFLGQVKNTAPLYRTADLLVSASRMEGLPFNVMEALYCGLPAVVSCIKGHRDLIRSGENGVLFSIDSDNAPRLAAESMIGLLTDENRLNKLKQNAFLEEKYLINNVRPKLVRILCKKDREVQTNIPEGAYS